MNSQLLGPIGVVVTLLVTVFLCQSIGMLGLALPAIVFAFLILSSRPRHLLGVFWIVTLVSPFIELILPPTLVKVAEQILGLYLLALLLGDFVITRRGIPGTRVINVILVVLLWLIGTSWYINHVPMTPFVFYLITYMKHFWVFYFTVRYVGNDVRGFWRLGLASMLLQCLANLLCYMGLNRIPFRSGREFVDISMGTLGDASYVAYFMLALLLVLVAYQRRAKSLSAGIATVILAAIALVQIFFTYTMHVYALMAGAVTVQLLVFRANSRVVMIKSMALVVIGAGIFMLLLSNAPLARATRNLISLESFQGRWRQMMGGTKIAAYREVLTNRSGYLQYPGIGGGPGNYTSQIAYLMGRPLSRLPHMFDIYTSSDRRFAGDRSSVLATPRTGYLSLWGETGPLGFLLYWGMYGYAGVRVWRQLRGGEYRNWRREVLAEALLPALAAFLVLNLLRDAAAVMPLNLGMWIWLGVLWNPDPPPEDEPPAPDAVPPPSFNEGQLT